MPKYSAFTFTVEPVRKSGRVSGYVVAGFFTREQLAALRSMIDIEDYIRAKLRVDNKSIRKGMAEAIDRAVN